ncbi:hypothetical protein [Meiothermus hypogaeus]|uniref:Lysine biosynthesis protein LysW n=2 Tax=Meiothermus hypogaeus TaxID=884155 RepID=A0A511QZJ7_9DEIN|nr:hypothetical protein [Meiothermus hypogaeus]RIH80872.1 lysine biosynthesis protein LysW [Meiothermus hypogaeus]GEM82136.1 hypothetical protein MHY01S_03020 [Meiothermus hypogaeus NBRC 106114]
METLQVAKCPVCGGLVEVAGPWVGLEVECPECGEVLRVVETQPLKLYYAFDPDEEPLLEEEHRVPRGE